MQPILEKVNIIPEYQFGFRAKHGTPEQCHRIINYSLESKKYCSGVFLDVQHAFDKVWHEGLFFKLKKLLPTHFYIILKSYLSNRHYYVKYNRAYSKIFEINAGVPQGSVLGPVLYTIFTSDMPVIGNILVATYADDTAVLAANTNPSDASIQLQEELRVIENWLTKWKIKINTAKSSHVTFTLRRGNCSSVYIYNNQIPQYETVKYLGLHIDRRLTWKSYIKAKRLHLNLKSKRLLRLLSSRSQNHFSLENKLRIYKAMLKPIWTYGIQLWGTASNSNIEILQRFQSKTLRSFADAPWYISNKAIHDDLEMPLVKDEIKRFSKHYLDRLSNHNNLLAIMLLDDTNEVRRLKRKQILDLPF